MTYYLIPISAISLTLEFKYYLLVGYIKNKSMPTMFSVLPSKNDTVESYSSKYAGLGRYLFKYGNIF